MLLTKVNKTVLEDNKNPLSIGVTEGSLAVITPPLEPYFRPYPPPGSSKIKKRRLGAAQPSF